MRTLAKLSLILLANWFATAHAIDADGTMHFAYKRPDFKVAPEDIPKTARAGDIELAGGVKIPAYSISISSGRADGPETFSPNSSKLDMAIKPEVAAQLDAYAYPSGIILVPKNWTVRTASVGVDGSMSFVFAPDKSGQTYLSFTSAGACVGCAYSNASLYFDEARKLAIGDDFPFYRKSDSIQSVRLNRSERGYRIKTADGNPIDGLAYFDASSDLPFFDVRISVSPEQHPLATAVLNQFVRP